MSVLNLLQFLGVQNSCLAMANILPLETDQRTAITDLLLSSAWSRGCQIKACSDTDSSAGHRHCSLQEAANNSISQGPTCHLLLPYPAHAITHQHTLPPLCLFQLPFRLSLHSLPKGTHWKVSQRQPAVRYHLVAITENTGELVLHRCAGFLQARYQQVYQRSVLQG